MNCVAVMAGTFNDLVCFRTMSEIVPQTSTPAHCSFALQGAYIVTMRNKTGSPEAYYVMGNDEQHAIDRAARIAGLKAGQVIGIIRA